MAELKFNAELFTVVNMAYEAPSDPTGQRWTLWKWRKISLESDHVDTNMGDSNSDRFASSILHHNCRRKKLQACNEFYIERKQANS